MTRCWLLHIGSGCVLYTKNTLNYPCKPASLGRCGITSPMWSMWKITKLTIKQQTTRHVKLKLFYYKTMHLFRSMLSTTSTRPLSYFVVNAVDVADVVDVENNAKKRANKTHKIKTIQLLLLLLTIHLFRSMLSPTSTRPMWYLSPMWSMWSMWPMWSMWYFVGPGCLN